MKNYILEASKQSKEIYNYWENVAPGSGFEMCAIFKHAAEEALLGRKSWYRTTSNSGYWWDKTSDKKYELSANALKVINHLKNEFLITLYFPLQENGWGSVSQMNLFWDFEEKSEFSKRCCQ